MDWVLFRCGYLLAPMKDYSVFFVGAENEHGEICIYGEIKKSISMWFEKNYLLWQSARVKMYK